jgi:hypothetical protein
MMNFFSSTSPGSGSVGANFTRKLYFYAEVDLPTGKERSMANEELIEELEKLVDKEEKIEEIWYYTHPLSGGFRILNSVAYHAYVVFKTDQWWWSIEKNNESVILQRSKKIEFVRNHCIRNKRHEQILNGVTCTKQKKVNSTVEDLIRHIHTEGFLNEDYHLLNNNCQEFADNIYGFF